MNIILDIDGTLWNTTEVVAEAWNEAIDYCEIDNIHVTAAVLQKEFGKPMNVIADDLFIGLSEDQKAKLLKVCCEYEHRAIEKNQDDLTYPGVKDTIPQLASKDKLFIVSNCQKGYIELVMAKNGWEKMITDYECFGKTGLSKGQNIKLVMKRNGLSEAYYVGDTFGDYEASKDAGTKFVFASYGFGSVPDYDKEIKNFSELLQL